MKFETGDLEDAVILLTVALAADPGEWWIEVSLHDGAVRDGYILEADESEVHIQNEAGDEPWGEYIPWTEIRWVRVVS